MKAMMPGYQDLPDVIRIIQKKRFLRPEAKIRNVTILLGEISERRATDLCGMQTDLKGEQSGGGQGDSEDSNVLAPSQPLC